MAKIHDGIYAGGAPIGGDEVRGENTGRHTSTIAWTDPGYATVFDRLDFLTEDGYHIIVEDLLLTWNTAAPTIVWLPPSSAPGSADFSLTHGRRGLAAGTRYHTHLKRIGGNLAGLIRPARAPVGAGLGTATAVWPAVPTALVLGDPRGPGWMLPSRRCFPEYPRAGCCGWRNSCGRGGLVEVLELHGQDLVEEYEPGLGEHTRLVAQAMRTAYRLLGDPPTA
jgi:hypothetical protein